jgi:2-polyprenyl-3-methyl-5-hydroxy-6-metoxy-1,4-benzoquinol methylase
MMDVKLEALNYLNVKYPLLAKANFHDQKTESTDYVAEYLKQVQIVTGVKIEVVMDAYAKTCFEFMKLQNKFLTTRRYAASSQGSLESSLYSQENLMEPYLLGLLSTYLFWENHAKIFDFYCKEFSPLAKDIADAAILEIGTGHGLFASYLLENSRSISYLGIDISKSSLEFSSNLFRKKFPSQQEQIRFAQKDATSSCFEVENKYDLAICCEVLEHVENPEILLQNIMLSLNKNGRVFVTTVINLEAIDHIYLFKNSTEIRNLFKRSGFAVEVERVYKLPNSTSELEQSNYAAIIAPISK